MVFASKLKFRASFSSSKNAGKFKNQEGEEERKASQLAENSNQEDTASGVRKKFPEEDEDDFFPVGFTAMDKLAQAVRWCPASDAELRETEKRLLSYVR